MLEERGPDGLPARAVTDLLGVRSKTVEQAAPHKSPRQRRRVARSAS
ncbi:hypothetical protein [Streptomyces levis]